MIRTTRVALAGIAFLALTAAPALAQSQDATPAEGSDAKPAMELPVGAPTPTEPAATETPEAPAAAGGEASDATASGAPAGSTVTDEDTRRAPVAPSNEVGEKFELPRVSDDNQVEMIAGLCGVQMKQMSPAACTCLGEAAMEDLSAPQRDYLIASVVAPPVAERMLGDGRVGDPDQKEIFAFLQSSSESCAAETAAAGQDNGAAASGTAPAEAMPNADGDAAQPAK